MRILALITARSGSKRLPGKNIRFLAGKPLIVWSIEVAQGIAEICDILVSTDDPVIADFCAETGALMPWLRPAALATDTARSIDVVLHALEWYEAEKGAVDGLLLLQPTSPFRTKKTVRRGIELFSKNGQQTVVGVSPSHAHPMWMFKMDGENMVPFMAEHGLETRSQDLPQTYSVNGSFYLASPATLRMQKSFTGARITPLIMHSNEEAIDIDTEWDWSIAQFVAEGFFTNSIEKI